MKLLLVYTLHWIWTLPHAFFIQSKVSVDFERDFYNINKLKFTFRYKILNNDAQCTIKETHLRFEWYNIQILVYVEDVKS